MLTVLLVIQAIVALAMIAVILLQRSNADGLSGLGGGGGGGKSLISSRTSANIMTRTTAILAAIFMINCLAMGVIASKSSRANIDYKRIEGINQSSEVKNPTDSSKEKEADSPTVPLAQ